MSTLLRFKENAGNQKKNKEVRPPKIYNQKKKFIIKGILLPHVITSKIA